MAAGQQQDEGRSDRELHRYYRALDSYDIADNFKDFDDAQNLELFKIKVKDPRSRNFVLDFSDHGAWCGFNLEAESFNLLLNTPRPPELNTRWINIWLPHEQKDVLEEVAKYFNFTPRLTGFMGAEQLKVPRSNGTSKTSSLSNLFHRTKTGMDSASSRSHRSPETSMFERSGDLEEGIPMSDFGLFDAQLDFKKAFNPYALASEIWHWSSIDWGRKCKTFHEKYHGMIYC
jgi:hypothetical protein